MQDDEQSVQENMEQYFQCPVCLDILNYPIILSCGHLTCFQCIQHTIENIDNSSCPVCQCPIKYKDVKAAFIGKMEGVDERGDIVKRFEEANVLRQEKAQNQQQNQQPFRFQLNAGGLGLMGGFQGININFGGQPVQNQPQQPLTFKEKVKRFGRKSAAFAFFGLILYLQIKESMAETRTAKVYYFP